MPIYEYQCQQCGLRVEKRQSVSDAPLSVCEKCHGKLEKQWSLSGFQFKGAGWYVTDYAGSKKEPATESTSTESTVSSDAASKPAKEASSSTASDSKPAAVSKESSS